jgi:hypothetical protein
MKISIQLHAPVALTSGKKPPVPIGYEVGWASESVWTLWRREQFFLTGIEPQPFGITTPYSYGKL